MQWDRASFLKSMREENNNSRKRYYYFGSPKDFLPAFPDSMTDESMRMNEVIRNEIGRTDTRINKDAPVIIIEHNPNRWQLYVMDYYHRRSIRIQENGRLSDIEFHKVLDPYMVFQEIGQYISGVIGGSFPATVNISDESMAKKKGFDKQSFRKASSKKARKPKH
ncbi:MAG: hypothetical protein D6732_24245 [Methanobacteriota archaeon]|nr:MAG: hypothetical protein D6732_24245 [Euryarchaeota archaeon]